MSMRTHDKLRKRFWRWTLGSLLLLASAPCGSPGPFAIVTLMGLAPGVASLHVHAQIDSAERDSDFSGSDPLDRFSLSFPNSRTSSTSRRVLAM